MPLQRTAALVIALSTIGLLSTGLHAAEFGDPATVYEDRTEATSGTITQLLPGNTTTPTQQMNVTKVRRVRVVGNTLVIEWGGTACTIIPQQFVLSMTFNKRANAEPTTQP